MLPKKGRNLPFTLFGVSGGEVQKWDEEQWKYSKTVLTEESPIRHSHVEHIQGVDILVYGRRAAGHVWQLHPPYNSTSVPAINDRVSISNGSEVNVYSVALNSVLTRSFAQTIDLFLGSSTLPQEQATNGKIDGLLMGLHCTPKEIIVITDKDYQLFGKNPFHLHSKVQFTSSGRDCYAFRHTS